VRAMVGRDLSALARPAGITAGPARLAARGLCSPRWFEDIDLDLHSGEIVALAGLTGAGRGDLARALAGITRIGAGTLQLDGRPVSFGSLREAMRRGIGFLPEERKSEGLFLGLGVADNIAAAVLPKVTRAGLFQRAKRDAIARRWQEKLAIKTRGPNQPVERLSGGNQQKVLLAKWLETAPRILIVEEPTKGVDVGTKFEIHRALRRLAEEGVAILMISSDLLEILAVADRIIVMRRGRIVGEMPAGEADEERVMALAARPHSEEEQAA
jgi:rhamnose transport system ATP-binding protein